MDREWNLKRRTSRSSYHYRDLRAAEREREKEEKEFQLKREALEIEKTEIGGRAR